MTRQSLELSIELYQPSPPAPYACRGTWRRHLSDELDSYSHEVKAMGGYWSAQFAVRDRQADLEAWLDEGLGRHVEVYDHALVLVWEGFVNQVDVSLGPLSISRGPLLEAPNRVRVVYSGTSTAISPPVQGTRTVTAVANDAAAQAKYGIVEQVVSLGGATAANATQVRDAFLAENREPRSTQSLGQAGGQQVVVNCLGYVHRMNYAYSATGAGTQNLSVKLAAVLNADPNGLFSSANAEIAANALQVTVEDDSQRLAWDIIKDLVAFGDAANNRHTFGVYGNRRVYYAAAPTDVAYRQQLLDPRQQVQTFSGGDVRPWDVRPGRWLFVPDFLVGRVQPADLRQDPRYVFIESVAYTAPYGVAITGGRLDTISQKLARMSLGGIGPNLGETKPAPKKAKKG